MPNLPHQLTDHPSVLRYLGNAGQYHAGYPIESPLGVSKDHIVCGEAIQVLSSFPNECVDLVHTSPPYNIDRPYEMSSSDKSSGTTYFNFLREVIGQLKRVLRPGGSIFWQTGYTQEGTSSHEIVPIDLLSYEIFREEPSSLLLWDRIIWRYWGGHAFTKKFTNKHETILWFVKPGAEPVFNVDTVREKAKEYDKRNNFWGRNPGNVWEVDRVAFGSTEQTSHIAVFPEEITERIVRACSEPGNLVLDPFAGSGTVPKVARGLGRHWIGIEISPIYAAESAIRVGYQQPSEADSLASELVKLVGFHSRKATLPLSEIQRRISAWLASVPTNKLYVSFRKDVDSVFQESNGRNLFKRDIWAKYDTLLGGQNRSIDPIQIADQLLAKCYKLKKQFNGVRRYESALLAVETVAKSILHEPEGIYLSKVMREEPSSFRLCGNFVEFLSTRRNVTSKPGEPSLSDKETTQDNGRESPQRQLML